MNNINYSSRWNGTVATEATPVVLNTAKVRSGKQSADFSANNSMDQGQPAIQIKTSETPHTDETLFSTYQPVNQSCILPIHQLLF